MLSSVALEARLQSLGRAVALLESLMLIRGDLSLCVSLLSLSNVLSLFSLGLLSLSHVFSLFSLSLSFFSLSLSVSLFPPELSCYHPVHLCLSFLCQGSAPWVSSTRLKLRAKRLVPSRSPSAVRYGMEKLSGSSPRLHIPRTSRSAMYNRITT